MELKHETNSQKKRHFTPKQGKGKHEQQYQEQDEDKQKYIKVVVDRFRSNFPVERMKLFLLCYF